MTTIRRMDQPVSHPDMDLLGMVPDARRLAEYLQRQTLPFTLGIYGHWGEGKTSFAKITVHFLRRLTGWSDLRFIEFSAWPYVNSDSIWRALLLRIAQEMYDVAEDQGIKQPEGGFLPRLRAMLRQEAIVLRANSESPSAGQLYQRLAQKVERSPTALANRSQTDSAQQANALTAQAFFEVLSRLLPGLSGLGNLLNGGFGATGPQAVVQSVEELQNEIRSMFAFALKKRVVVLVDDLDRCMPQVALDVLEMVKIFFFQSAAGGANLLFIVAADDNLIGRGLLARHRELGRSDDSPQFHKMIGQRGREYFEKIIQFGVNVPDKGEEQIHRFVAESFPDWACATDILGTAFGGNPRRLRQQCDLLTYKHLVAKDIRAQ